MRFRLPKPDYRARFLLMGFGLILFFWMGLEDNGTLTVSILGAVLATALICYQSLKRYGGAEQEFSPLHFFSLSLVFGAGLGAAASIATVLLMFFKTAWHGHEFPDYPPELMRDMLLRLPAWALAGGLIALGSALLFWALKLEQG